MDFSNQSITALLLGTFSIAAMHALIPSHWLSFAVVGRRQRWTTRQTLTITLLAGVGHILLTLVLGFALVIVGKELFKTIPAWAEHAATAAVLIGLGVWFVLPNLRPGHAGCHHAGHSHEPLEELVEETPGVDANDCTASYAADTLYAASGTNTPSTVPPRGGMAVPAPAGRLARLGSAPTAMGALVLGMTLSPCLDLLSVYVGASALPWHTLAAIGIIMSATTLSIMVTLVWLTMQGLERLHLGWLERNEGLAIGGVLIALGVLLLFL